MMSEPQIIEEDETGRVCGRYNAHLTVIPEAQPMSKGIIQTLSDIFMPAGYPASVTSDYFEYQLYDSLQAFSSSIAGLLASRAVLEGVGVGDGTASATQALLLTIAQDAVGRLATILFAWRIGTALEPEAKRYRLLADIFNDGAMILDCLSPALPPPVRILSLCTSGALRALCGVAAGGAKAALSVHFARANNVGDLNAKDSSQETVIGLLGMLAGSFVVSRVASPAATWTLLLTLLAIHISTNYLAVRAIVMPTLNRQRAAIAYSLFRGSKAGTAPSPHEVSGRERIFARGDVLRAQDGRIMGWCEIGVPLHRVFPQARDGAIVELFSGERYVLWFATFGGTMHPACRVCLKKGARGADQLKAWVHAMELAYMILEAPKSMPRVQVLAQSVRQVNAVFPDFMREMTRVGWDVDNPALMTTPSFRISIIGSEVDMKKRE